MKWLFKMSYLTVIGIFKDNLGGMCFNILTLLFIINYAVNIDSTKLHILHLF